MCYITFQHSIRTKGIKFNSSWKKLLRKTVQILRKVCEKFGYVNIFVVEKNYAIRLIIFDHTKHDQ